MDKDTIFYNHEVIFPSKNFPIMVYFHATGLDYVPNHWHRSLEIVDYINTTCRLWYNGVSLDLPPDSLVIINSGDVHAYLPENCKNPQGVSLIFPYDFMMQYGIDIDHIRFTHTAGDTIDARLRQSLHKFSDLWYRQDTDPYYHLLCAAEIFNILHLMMTYYQSKDNVSPFFLKHLERCHDLISYIDQHHQENISLESVATYFHLSVGYLCRFFKKNLGITFKQHLLDVRIRHAVSLIGSTDHTLLDISMECGFPDYRSFIDAFRKTYHVTPQQFRANPQNKLPAFIRNY